MSSTILGFAVILVIKTLFQQGTYGLQCTANHDCFGLKNRNKFCCQSNECKICPTCYGNTDCGPLEYCCKSTLYQRGNATYGYCRSSCIGAFCQSYNECGNNCCRSNKCVNCSQTFCRYLSECQSGQLCCSNGRCNESCTEFRCYSNDECASPSKCCRRSWCMLPQWCIEAEYVRTKSKSFPTASVVSGIVISFVILVILLCCYQKQKKRAIPPASHQDSGHTTNNIVTIQNNVPSLACNGCALTSRDVTLYRSISHSVPRTVEPSLFPPSYSLHNPLASSDIDHELHLGVLGKPNIPPPPYIDNEQTVSSETYNNNDLPPSYENQV